MLYVLLTADVKDEKTMCKRNSVIYRYNNSCIENEVAI